MQTLRPNRTPPSSSHKHLSASSTLNRPSAETFQFVATTIPSVHTLEVLLLLFNREGHAYTQEEVLAQMRSSSSATTTSLQALAASGVIQQSGTSPIRFFYDAQKSAAHSCIVELALMYLERSSSVIRMIHAPRPGALEQNSRPPA